ncbi:hypothetical protein DFH28DRAFT_883892 [Melampsora americana]|nr:hypothetical protein DFH28DRAFT_883892 [Melampsora americana]
MTDNLAFGTTDYPLWIKLKEKMSCKRLGFLISLDKDIDYNKLTCSIAKLRELMDVLGVNHKNIKSKSRKEIVVNYYRANAAPIVDHFIISMGLNLDPTTILAGTSPSTNKSSEIDVMMAGSPNFMLPSGSDAPDGPCNSTPASPTENLSTPDPVSKSTSKVEELRKGLKKSVNKMVSRGFNKSALVKLQSHLKAKVPSSPANLTTPSDIRRPHRLLLEEISKKDRDTIRKALQCYCPQLWIPINVAVSRPMLVALYNAFILGGEEPELCRGVHYDIFPMEEIIFDGGISFPDVSSFTKHFFHCQCEPFL